jgi:hypothetical protein
MSLHGINLNDGTEVLSADNSCQRALVRGSPFAGMGCRSCQLADRQPCEDGDLSPGTIPWRYAAMPGSAISDHTMIAPE